MDYKQEQQIIKKLFADALTETEPGLRVQRKFTKLDWFIAITLSVGIGWTIYLAVNY